MRSDLPSLSCQLFAKCLSKNASTYGVATYVCSPLLKSAPLTQSSSSAPEKYLWKHITMTCRT